MMAPADPKPRYSFYRLDAGSRTTGLGIASLPYPYRLWRPSWYRVIPRSVPLFPFSIWWAMHCTHIFRNPDYGLFLVYDGAMIIHRSGVFPGYLRFPFMEPDDLQIGDTWTHPAYRGRGIAHFAVEAVVGLLARPGRHFWYVVKESNAASLAVIEKSGFRLAGEGMRRKRLGLHLLGVFELVPSRSSSVPDLP